jgi:8-oxo-dGTP pyrophosphatase MutT (NUDIX family)
MSFECGVHLACYGGLVPVFFSLSAFRSLGFFVFLSVVSVFVFPRVFFHFFLEFLLLESQAKLNEIIKMAWLRLQILKVFFFFFCVCNLDT